MTQVVLVFSLSFEPTQIFENFDRKELRMLALDQVAGPLRAWVSKPLDDGVVVYH